MPGPVEAFRGSAGKTRGSHQSIGVPAPNNRSFDASLERLGLEHVDLYLIHWPMPAVDLYVE
ncbi:aldo/keto reductase, partial [Streptomyces alkaliphilus]|uniref:aldo/keto reductase n=1 Tax=Streptomyces alkaliphilus TaxID=1472722 RepID=UPI0034D2EA21